MESFADEDDVVLQLPDPVIVEQRQFQKTKGAEIFTRYGQKQYRAVYTKGQILPDLNVAPYGYQNSQ